MIANKILEARTRKGYSQAELAKLSGVYKSTIQRYEKGAKPIRRNLEKIAIALGQEVEYFYNEKPELSGEYKSNLSVKLKKVIEFNPAEQRVVEFVLDQILEKRKVLTDLNGIITKVNR
jgi:transcriptional regulator with XRE-family HTH domain